MGALDSQPQVIKLTSCLPMVGNMLSNEEIKKGGNFYIVLQGVCRWDFDVPFIHIFQITQLYLI
jgi:hypothetical protein